MLSYIQLRLNQGAMPWPIRRHRTNRIVKTHMRFQRYFGKGLPLEEGAPTVRRHFWRGSVTYHPTRHAVCNARGTRHAHRMTVLLVDSTRHVLRTWGVKNLRLKFFFVYLLKNLQAKNLCSARTVIYSRSLTRVTESYLSALGTTHICSVFFLFFSKFYTIVVEAFERLLF